MNIKIKWLYDTHQCETCGTSYAEGAEVSFDGQPHLVLPAVAHCYGGENYTQDDVYRRIIEKLGHTVEEH